MNDIIFCLMLLTIHERGYNREQLIKVRKKLNDMLSTAPADTEAYSCLSFHIGMIDEQLLEGVT